MEKPTYYPEWATEDTTLPATGQTNKVRPREILRNIGWDKGQIPTCEEWNWVLNNIYEWAVYYDNVIGTPTNLATPNTIALRDSTGSLHFYDLYVDNNLEVTGTGSFSGELSAVGISSTSGLSVSSGDTTLQDVTIEGSIVSLGDSNFKGGNTFSGGITSSGSNTWSGSQEVTGSFTAEGTVTLKGSITSSATNYWNGTQNFSGGASFSGNNTHSGTETFSGTLNLKTSSKSTNGYTYLPNDIILQWGIWDDSTEEGEHTITFPTPFPTTALNISLTLTIASGIEDGSDNNDVCVNLVSFNKTSMIVNISYINSSALPRAVNFQVIGY